jgi:lipase
MLAVPVDGGALAVRRWGDAAPALAIHGITASHLSWAPLADRVPALVAPDLRGRGASADLPGPWGMARHADDMTRVLDAVEVDRAVVVGHSMGGFVAVVLAHRHPDRVERLVLVDGGLPLPPPPGVPAEELLQAVIGPAAQRLSMTFASREAYRDYWRAHPALGPAWSDAVQAYVDYDLVGAPPAMRSRTSRDAVSADSIDLHTGEAFATAFAELSHPAVFLRAERGLLDQPDGLYSPAQETAATQALPNLTARLVPDSNHYTITLAEPGVTVVAEATVTGAGVG